MKWSALFPGQGSQHPGMGKFLWDEFKVAKEIFEEGSDALSVDLKKLCFDGSESDLALTENTQPVLVLVSTVTYRVLEIEFGFSPQIAAGHSVGEYSALVAGKAMPFASAIKAVRTRGKAMQDAVPVGQGGMTAVMGVSAEMISKVCEWAEKKSGQAPVSPANMNAPGQIVISGNKKALDFLAANFKAEEIPLQGRVKFIPLKVSAPFHCPMMKPAEDVMARVLKDIQFTDARFPIVQNVHGQKVSIAAELRENLVKQVCAPVLWIDCMETIVKEGFTQALEVGCGKVISGLGKKISPNLSVININSMDDLKAAGAALRG